MRDLGELLKHDNPAWPEVQTLIADCPHPVEVVPPQTDQREEVLLTMQNSLGSTLGAVIWHTGGVAIDHGWVRLLGSGGTRLSRTPLYWADTLGWWENKALPPGAPVIAEDILGGLFALNWGQIDQSAGINDVFYFAPDTLEWESLNLGYTALMTVLLTDRLATFYKDLRWDGWEAEVSALGPDQGISAWPPPWTKEGRDVSAVSRRAVPIREIIEMQFDIAKQLNGKPVRLK